MTSAVLLTCHGTVDDVADIPAFVAKIRRGRPAPAEVLHEVRRRFELIGGSPLMQISHAQAEALEARLGVPVRAAGRLWSPYPREVIAPLEGVKRVISLPLAPQSVHIYHRFATEDLAELPVEVRCAPPYGLEPMLVAAFARAIVEARDQLPAGAPTTTVLSAHSLPTRVVQAGDPYQRDFESMAEAVKSELARDHGFDAATIRVAYQSQGMDGGDWLGPALPEVFAEARSTGSEALLVAPIGFVAEHVETLYDIDVEAKAVAEDLGFSAFTRMPAMNARVDFIDALEAVARPLLEAD